MDGCLERHWQPQQVEVVCLELTWKWKTKPVCRGTGCSKKPLFTSMLGPGSVSFALFNRPRNGLKLKHYRSDEVAQQSLATLNKRS